MVSLGVVEGRPILLTLTLLQQQQSRNGSSFTALGGTGERGPAQEAAAQPELVVLKNKYGAQAFSGAVQKDCSPPEALAHIQLLRCILEVLHTIGKQQP